VDVHVGARARVAAAAREVVHRWKDQCVGELCGPAHQVRAAQQGRARLRGRAGRHADADVLGPLRPGEQVRERPPVPWRPKRRSRRHLSAAHSRSGHLDARVRAHRSHSLRGIRWLLTRIAERQDQRLGVQGARDGGWWIPPRLGRAAQAQCRQGAGRHAVHRARGGGAAASGRTGRRGGRGHARRARQVVAPAHAPCAAVVRARGDGC